MNTLLHLWNRLPRLISSLIIFGVTAAGGYFLYDLKAKELMQTRQEFAQATSTLEHNIADLSSQLAILQSQKDSLIASLEGEIERNTAYGQQVESLVSTVQTLDKLTKTDRELLQKYSKVFFLSENFVPSALTDIPLPDIANKDKPQQIHLQIWPRLQALLASANANGTPLLILSGYRSFGSQTTIKAGYKVTYGAGTANTFSADQGYSEHQLGSAIDFTTQKNGTNLDAFEKTPQFAWLKENAHKHGFILSYPKGNTYYTYEPWHWRYVGVELATRLHDEGKNFYDLDQRDINTYLVKIFD